MKQWFTVTLSYMGVAEDGKMKNIKQPYLIDAMTYTEAEARMYEIAKIIIPENTSFAVEKIVKNNYQEAILNGESEKYFKGVLRYSVTDSESGKEKETKSEFVLQADDIQHALAITADAFSQMMVDYTIPSMVEMPIVEAYTVEEMEAMKENRYAQELERMQNEIEVDVD